MRYVCLAGGYGKRMRPLTNYIAKTMMPIGMRPFLSYTLDELLMVGEVDEIVIVSGHLGHQVREYVGTNWFGIPVVHVTQHEPRGTGHALALAHVQLRFTEPTIVWLGDCFFSRHMFRDIGNSPGEAVLGICLHGHHPSHQHNEIETYEDPMDLPVGARVKQCWGGRSEYVDVGIWRLPPEILDRIADRNYNTGERRILPAAQEALQDGADVRAVRVPEWTHLGDEPTPYENYVTAWNRLLARPAARLESDDGSAKEKREPHRIAIH